MVIDTGDMLLRLGVSVVLGAAVGYERERGGRPAGLRTHLLVSLASATFMLVSTQFVYFQSYDKGDLVDTDPSRIAASVVSGVGFLGAGAILRTGLGVQGLTTAASLWMTSALGLAAGGGMYLVAVTATAVSLLSLVYLRRIEGKQWRLLQRRVAVVVKSGGPGEQAVSARLALLGAAVTDVDYDRNVRTGKTRLVVDVRSTDRVALDALVADLAATPGVRRVKVTRPG